MKKDNKIYTAKISGTQSFTEGKLNSVYGNGYDSIIDEYDDVEYIQTDTIRLKK